MLIENWSLDLKHTNVDCENEFVVGHLFTDDLKLIKSIVFNGEVSDGERSSLSIQLQSVFELPTVVRFNHTSIQQSYVIK